MLLNGIAIGFVLGCIVSWLVWYYALSDNATSVDVERIATDGGKSKNELLADEDYYRNKDLYWKAAQEALRAMEGRPVGSSFEVRPSGILRINKYALANLQRKIERNNGDELSIVRGAKSLTITSTKSVHPFYNEESS